MTEDSASVADKIKKKLHIQSKSGLEKFQVIFIVILIIVVIVIVIHQSSFQEWSAKNIYLAGGFTGGFFLGIASSWSRSQECCCSRILLIWMTWPLVFVVIWICSFFLLTVLASPNIIWILNHKTNEIHCCAVFHGSLLIHTELDWKSNCLVMQTEKSNCIV